MNPWLHHRFRKYEIHVQLHPSKNSEDEPDRSPLHSNGSLRRLSKKLSPPDLFRQTIDGV
jgi:hypothetical protein